MPTTAFPFIRSARSIPETTGTSVPSIAIGE